MTKLPTKLKDFSEEEMLIILESARLGMSDAAFFDKLATDMDVSDQRLIDVRERLLHYLSDDGDPQCSCMYCTQADIPKYKATKRKRRLTLRIKRGVDDG